MKAKSLFWFMSGSGSILVVDCIKSNQVDWLLIITAALCYFLAITESSNRTVKQLFIREK